MFKLNSFLTIPLLNFNANLKTAGVCYHENDAYNIAAFGEKSVSDGRDASDDTEKKNVIYDEIAK